jgi:hypothetical protein
MPRSGKLSASKPVTKCWTPGDDRKLRNMLEIGKTADGIAVDLKRARLAAPCAIATSLQKNSEGARLVELGLKAKAR